VRLQIHVRAGGPDYVGLTYFSVESAQRRHQPVIALHTKMGVGGDAEEEERAKARRRHHRRCERGGAGEAPSLLKFRFVGRRASHFHIPMCILRVVIKVITGVVDWLGCCVLCVLELRLSVQPATSGS
jgi:hypothetical protein